jgi:hypothetical protein
MGKYIHEYYDPADYDSHISSTSGDYIEPDCSLTDNAVYYNLLDEDLIYDEERYENRPLTFEILTSGIIKLCSNSQQRSVFYRINNGN